MCILQVDGDERNNENDTVVMYNIYFDDSHKLLAAAIVNEQIESILKSETYNRIKSIDFVTINGDIDLSQTCPKCNHVRTLDHGNELDTLQLVYEHCLTNPQDRVAYIHDKGSLHNTPENARQRQMLMKAVFSRECFDFENECDTCSARFDVLRNFYSGNMWIAKCPYVNKLVPPNKFAELR